MNKEKQSLNSFEEKSKDTDSSSNNEKRKIKATDALMKFKLLKCIKKYYNIILKEINGFFSNSSILSQYLLFLIPSSIILLVALLLIHYHAFEKVIKFDLYYAVKDEYLKPIITDLDDIHFDISSSEIKDGYEDFGSIFFFKIYFKELISMGLLNESSTNKIYPGISNTSESLYKLNDEFQKNIKMNSYFTIPKNDSETYIDKRNDSLSELGKLYYYMLPTISFEEYNREIYLNQSFFIVYELDKETKKIKNDYFYFSFPRMDNDALKTSNFIVDNTFIWPQISYEKVIHGEKIEDSFYRENWFVKQDYDFRVNSNVRYNMKFTAFHLNYNYYGKLNKTNIFSLQNLEIFNDKYYIINLIFFVYEQFIIEDPFHYSIFLIFNDTYLRNTEETERYSDNLSYLIFKSNIIEFSLSSQLYMYFHYGIYDKNGNFFNHGAFFDGFDIEKFAEPLTYYNTIKNFNIDLRYFSSLYLYTLLFINTQYNISTNKITDNNQFDFIDINGITETICSNFNYSSYKEYLMNENIDCWNIQNLLYYQENSIEKNKGLHHYISMPYCICLPLYCLRKNEKNFNPNNCIYGRNISLPERCQNYLKYFNNNNEEEEETKQQLLKYGEAINMFSNNLKEKLDDEYFTYKYVNISHFSGIYFLIVNLVDNSILNNLLVIFLDYMTIFQFFFFITVTIGFFILIAVANYILIRNIRKISCTIFATALFSSSTSGICLLGTMRISKKA